MRTQPLRITATAIGRNVPTFRRWVLVWTFLTFLLQPVASYGYLAESATRVLPRERAVAAATDIWVRQLVHEARAANHSAVEPPIRLAAFDDDDDALVSIIGALRPRNCVLAATPNPVVVGVNTTLLLTLSGCTGSPSSYTWTGAGVATGTTTTAPSLTITAPTTPGSYAYSAIAKKGAIPSLPATTTVQVQLPPPPTFTTFDPSPMAVKLGQNPTTAMTIAGATSVQHYYGTQSITPLSVVGATYTLPNPGSEGVYLFRVVASNAGGTTERSKLLAVSTPPNPDLVSAPGSTPADVGTIAGNFGVTDSGAASYSIPLKIPPGSAGLQPNLALNYNSQSGNGHLGVGWSLSGLSAITRCPKTLAQDGARVGVNYDIDATNDAYCLDGARLVQVAAKTDPATCGANCVEYRTERDSFSRVYRFEADPNVLIGPYSFRVYTKAGQVLEYSARHWVVSWGWNERDDCRPTPENPTGTCLPTGRGNVAKMWVLDQVKDRFGNSMEIDYEGEGVIPLYTPVAGRTTSMAVAAYPPTEPRVREIRYTLNASGAGRYQRVAFEYSLRDSRDQHRFYDQGGGESLLTRKLDAIRTYIDASTANPTGAAAKEYRLSYGYGGFTNRLRLTGLQECDPASGVCLPATTFSWSDNTNPNLQGPRSGTFSQVGGNTGDFHEYRVAELDGDGRSDLMRRHGTDGLDVAVCKATAPSQSTPIACALWRPSMNIDSGQSWLVADFTGDGKADLVGLGNNPGEYVTSCPINSAGTGFAACSGSTVTKATDGFMLQGDFNGDGKIDFLFYRGAGTDALGGLIYRFDLHLSTGSGLAAAIPVTFGREAAMPTARDQLAKLLVVGDFDGDGRADVAQKRCLNDTGSCSGQISRQWRIYFADLADLVGNFVAPVGWVDGPVWTSDHSTLGDFNGDGLADFATPIYDDQGNPNGFWQICLSAGDGSFSRYQGLDANNNALYASTCHTVLGPVGGLNKVVLGDFNGDGRTDLAIQSATSYPVASSTWTIWLVRGSAVVDGNGTNVPSQQSLEFVSSANWTAPVIYPNDVRYDVKVGDFNGDGRTDLMTGSANSVQLGFVNGKAPDLLEQITTGLRATTDIGYAPLTDAAVYTRGTTAAAPDLDIQSPLYVVARTDASTAQAGKFYTTQYRYAGLRGNTRGRGLLGFASREVLENQVATAVGAAPDASQTLRTLIEYRQDWPVAGQPDVIHKYARTTGGAEIEVNRVTHTWLSRLGTAVAAGHPASVQVFLNEVLAQQWELDGAALPSTTTTTTGHDLYGNVPTTTVVSSDGFSTTTSNEYHGEDVGRWLLGRVTQSTVSKSTPDGAALARVATFVYNPTESDPNGRGCRGGLLCSESVEPTHADTTLSVATTYSYDSFGNRTTAA